MTKQLTYGSLFSGIGGIDLGLDRAGMHCEWQVEIDAYCQKVLAKHWPDVARHGDIRECGVHNLEPVDLICGGFPCQDISNAGKRAGITGERSGLWKEFYRVICELQPQYILVENVSALLHRGIERVLGDLAQSGYDAEWQVLSAEAFGAPHLRERVFIVAYTQHTRLSFSRRRNEPESSFYRSFNSDRKDVSSLPNTSSATTRMEEYRGSRQERQSALTSQSTILRQAFRTVSAEGIRTSSQDVPDADRQGLAVGQVFGSYAAAQLTAFKRDCSTGAGQWAIEPDVDRVAHGVSHRVDRLRGLGNAVVPQVAEYVGRCILAAIEAESEVSA